MLPARLSERQIASTYRRLAPIYDLLVPLIDRRARELTVELADVRDGERILDIGTGTGRTWLPLARRNPKGLTVGLDATPAMLARARRKGAALPKQNWQLVIGDARSLPFDTSSFDLVTCSFVLEIFPPEEIERVLTEVRRVLRPGGRAVFTYEGPPMIWYQRASDLLYRLSPALKGGARSFEIEPFLFEAGFSNIRTQRVRRTVVPVSITRVDC